MSRYPQSCCRYLIIAALAIVAATATIIALHKEEPDDESPYEKVEKFLTTKWKSFDEEQLAASKLGVKVVPILIELLNKPRVDVEKCQARCVAALGRIGDETAVDALIDFYENTSPSDASFTPDTLIALYSVPPSLARLAAHGSDKALNKIIVLAQPSTWKNKLLPWATADHHFYPYDEQLKNWMYALALCGQRRGREVLEQIRTQATDPKHIGWANQSIEASKRLTWQQRSKYLGGLGLEKGWRGNVRNSFWNVIDKVRYSSLCFWLALGFSAATFFVLCWLIFKKLRPSHRINGVNGVKS